MTERLLQEADLAGMIGDREKRIGIKPNLVSASPASEGGTTHPEVVEGLIRYLQRHGFYNLAIMEGSWVGGRTEEAFEVCGYRELAERFHVELIDAQKEKSVTKDCGGMELHICHCAEHVDFMINVPVLKGHCQTRITCALKNMKGLLPNGEKRRFHAMGLHRPIAHLALGIRQDFILVDNICGDLDFEEGGNPVTMNRVLGFKDPVLCDSYVCDCMGYTVDDIPYIRMAADLGVGSTDTEHANFIYLNEAQSEGKFRMSHRVQNLAKYADAKDACSACYGSLIYALDRLNDAGKLRGKKTPICIGQAYKGQTGEIGIGQCTCGFNKFVKGCPPKAIDIVEFLENEWK